MAGLTTFLENELFDHVYARTAITFGAPTSGAGSNSAAVTFPTGDLDVTID